MAFKGTYQFVEIEIGDGEVTIATLDEKRAASPNTIVGVVVDFANQIDRLLVVGDDAYKMGMMPLALETTHQWCEREGFGKYSIDKKPDGTADMLMELLSLKEK